MDEILHSLPQRKQFLFRLLFSLLCLTSNVFESKANNLPLMELASANESPVVFSITTAKIAKPSICDGSAFLDLIPTGGVAPYHYVILKNSAPFAIVDDNTAHYQFDAPIGNYDITVTDGNGLQATVKDTLKPLSLKFLNKFDIKCLSTLIPRINQNLYAGSIEVMAMGGAGGPYTYSIGVANETPTDITNVLSTTYVFENLVNATYTISVTDANGCTAKLPEDVTIYKPSSDPLYVFIKTIAASKLGSSTNCYEKYILYGFTFCDEKPPNTQHFHVY